MADKRPFFPPASRVLVGVAVIAASAMLTIGKAQSIAAPMETLAWVTEHRSPGDSAVYASAAYHAAYASEDYRTRWKPTGYMTLGTVGGVLGLALVLSAVRGSRRVPVA